MPDVRDVRRIVQSSAHRLLGPDDVDPVLEAIGGAPLVLLGEATHGSHEFCRLRAVLSRRLIFRASLTQQFDAVVDRTPALTPLDAPPTVPEEAEPETFPAGI